MKTKIKNFIAAPDEQFVVRPVKFGGGDAFLIFPQHVGVKWTQDNKIFRSLIVDGKGNVLSSGFPKFVNIGENPEHFPPPTSLEGANVIGKEDGSLGIFDLQPDGSVSIRTRGTVCASQLESGEDFRECLRKYPGVAEMLFYFPNHSLLFEVVTPNQRIVLDYGPEPDMFFIGAINKDTLDLLYQETLDNLAAEWGFKRPKRYEVDSLDDLVSHIENAEGIEGCCIYTNNDRSIHKLKSQIYLALHRLKSELGSYKRVVEFFVECDFELDTPPHEVGEAFYSLIESSFDYEVAKRCEPEVEKVCAAWAETRKLILDIKSFVGNMAGEVRKEQARKIMSRYPKYPGICFSLLDGKEIPKKKMVDIILGMEYGKPEIKNTQT